MWQKEAEKVDEESAEKLKKALLRRALGCSVKDEVCEYSIGENGEPILSKKKVTRRTLPADLSALKLLLEKFLDESDIEKMSDEELIKERSRLLKLLKEEEDANREMHSNDEV